MNTTIHAQTTYDEQICSSLVYLMLHKLRRWPRYILLARGFATVIISGLIMLTEGAVSALPFLVMIFGSLLCTAAFFLRQLATKLLTASYGKNYPTISYTFAPEEIHIVNEDRDHDYSYGYILRLLEMSGLLFMFMRDGQVYILRQKDVQGGYDQLKAVLEERIRNA